MTDLQNFRIETREWLSDNCPPSMRIPAQSDKDTCWGGRNPNFSCEEQNSGCSVWPQKVGLLQCGQPSMGEAV